MKPTEKPLKVSSEKAEPTRSLELLLKTPELSSYRESLLEQLFCADLVQACWTAGHPPVELSHAFVDFRGYDLVATCGAVTRHIQLKAVAGKAVHWDLHRDLALKPSACCVLLYPTVAKDASRIDLLYRFYGGKPGQPLAFSADLRPPPHRRPDAAGQPDAEGQADGARRGRLNHLRVPRAHFSPTVGVGELVTTLFGSAFPEPATAADQAS